MIVKKNNYTMQFKLAAVRELEKGRTVAELASDLNIPRRVLYEWYWKYPSPDRDTVERKVRETAEQKKKAAGGGSWRKMAVAEARRVQGEREAALLKVLSPDLKKVEMMLADPLRWLQKHTRTTDSHWREAGAGSPCRPFPDKPYFRPLMEAFWREPVMFVEKSRDLMISWLFVGLFTHKAMTTANIEVLFQSHTYEKSLGLIEYAKVLYENQDKAIKQAYPLPARRPEEGILEFANGSRIVAIAAGKNKVRSRHPWGLLLDDAAFMSEAGECYDHAVPVCRKIVVVSTTGPGWFAEQCQNAWSDVSHPALPRGMSLRRMSDNRPVYRVHYSADPERDAGWAETERKKYSSQGAWDREQEIIHEGSGRERIFAGILGRYAEKIVIEPARFHPEKHWQRFGGFDHGRTNPTAALVAWMDDDGVLYISAEYYQPVLSLAEHRSNLAQLKGFNQSHVYADPSIFYSTEAQANGGFEAVSDIYARLGITNLIRAKVVHETLGIECILDHWRDLDHREPTLKIVCPREKRDISRPIYGIHNDGCPNLLWELRRACKDKTGIVDQDNHLRDALKYLCVSTVEAARQAPTRKTKQLLRQLRRDDPAGQETWLAEDAIMRAQWKKSGGQPKSRSRVM